MSDRDYAALGLVAGLEIHQQLDTVEKLFCACPTSLRDPEAAVRTVTRYLHPTRSELGEIDEAAVEESRVEREFEYLAYDTTCLVEEDDEPPGRLDAEALSIALEIAGLLDMTVVDSAQVMRKIVIDGSNTSGFQRSTLVATDGEIRTDAGPVSIDDLLLEEESAQRVEETATGVRYSLDRLGIPLVEVGTGPDIRSPEQARAAAEHLGMLLRSTGRVKRGLGTIRQDVNISIAEGARVEVKGVQRLDDIDDIVRLEVDRQVALLDVATELGERDASIGEARDVTGVFEGTDAGVVGSVLDDGGVVRGLRLAGFEGLVGRDLQPDRRLGTELSDHARRHGAGGIFHTDELPGYGVTEGEVAALREAVDAGEGDAVAIVAADADVAESAIEAVAERARVALEGVPEETRGANEDGTTRYLRPLPGAARMYPETDVPPVEPDLSDVEAPELLTDRVERYVADLDLDPGLAEQVAYGPHVAAFDDAVERGVDPTLAANTLASTLTELRRDDVPVGALSEDQLLGALDLVTEGELAADSLPRLLRTLASDADLGPAEAVEREGLGVAAEETVREVVVEVVERNEAQVAEEGMGAFSALMGECMAALGGSASGETVSELLREEIARRVSG